MEGAEEAEEVDTEAEDPHGSSNDRTIGVTSFSNKLGSGNELFVVYYLYSI